MADENLKPRLELRELELKVRELELSLKELEKPPYRKLSHWTSIITVLIAIFGFGYQSCLSSLKNAKADLETTRAEAKKDTLDKQIKLYNDSLGTVIKKRDSALKDYHQISSAYIELKSAVAFTQDSISKKTQKEITKANETVSPILIKNNLETILKSAIVRIYYLPALKEKAERMNNILLSKGVQSKAEVSPVDISRSLNKIVYYNDRQMDYCEAVQLLLIKNGWAKFEARKSSGANASTQFFKIYVTS